jgi:hypothetical protein
MAHPAARNAILPRFSMALKLPLAWLPLLLAVLPAACTVESDPVPAPIPYYPGGSASATPAGSAGELIVDVDTNQVMTAKGGGGVGVFVEYKTGGHWHVYWTCDTNVNPSSSSCAVGIHATANTGTIDNLKAEGAATPAASGPGAVDVQATVATDVQGMTFDTLPGAVIAIDATVEGTRDGHFFFFVQNGVVDGSTDPSKLSDPMLFHPTSP